MKNLILRVAACLAAAAAISCSENKEMDDLAKGQRCLDEVPQAAPEQADSCLQYVEKYTSQQANILKCSIYMTSGGLVESKVIKAAEALQTSSGQTNKEASYMAVLSLDRPNVDAGYTKAIAADEFCQQTGVPGLKYISGVIVAGTYMNKTIKAITGNELDINNPTAVNAAVDQLLNDCTANPPAGACASDLPTLGSAVVSLAGSYCSSASADAGVCTEVNSAVDSAGGVPANVGQAIFCYLKDKTYNAGTGECNP